MDGRNQAIVIAGPDNPEIRDVPMPTLPADDYLIVKTTAVAVNPTDWKHVVNADKLGCVGARVGCDYAGVVEDIGPRVTKGFKKGDRVCGPVNGSNAVRLEDGSFAKYIAVKSDLQITIPDNISDEEAATLGIAVTTIGQALYQTLKLPMPTEPARDPFPILIYGGSTAMGISGIQYAKLSGLKVIATSSLKNFDYLKSLGADAVIDYRSPTAHDDISAFAEGSLKFAWDCLSIQDSAIFCGRALDKEGSHYAALLPRLEGHVREVNADAEVSLSLYYSVFGEPFWYGAKKDAVPENFEFGRMFWELSRDLIAQGKVKPINVILNRGGSGLDGVLVGLKESQKGNVSAGKLVYTM